MTEPCGVMPPNPAADAMAITSPRPAAVSETEALRLKHLVLTKKRGLRRRRDWHSTAFWGVPGWVLAELTAEGRMEWRKPDASSPNLWR